MQFEKPLIEGRLIRRYKRFLADVELADGRTVTAHTPNTGSMKSCSSPGTRVWLADSGNPARKYPLGWELVEADSGALTGINTALPNALVAEAIGSGVVGELAGYAQLRREVRYGREGSRIDLLLQDAQKGSCYVEVKNVTLVEEGVALFPDAVTARGAKHLRELMAMAAAGHRAVIFFCVQRNDAAALRPADAIDPFYGDMLRQAVAAGVEALAYAADVRTSGVALDRRLPVELP